MKNIYKDDITSVLISEDEIISNISKILPDAIVLDKKFRIINVSEKVCKVLEYSLKELIGLPISFLTDDYTICDDNYKINNSNNSLIEYNTNSENDGFKCNGEIQEKIKNGFFEEYTTKLRTKDGKKIAFGISGFYLGLIGDIRDLIILKVINSGEIQFLKTRLNDKNSEMDEFIYQSSHRLRGPLATLKGLITIARMDTKSQELNAIFNQMDIFANLLDDRLFRLMYFAESDKVREFFPKQVTIALIAKKLLAHVKKETSALEIKYLQNFENKDLNIQNGELIFRMLQDISSFFCNQLRSTSSEMAINFISNNSYSEINVKVKGLVLDDLKIEKLKVMNFGFVEILKEPEFSSLYSAKKIVIKLKGNIYFTVVNPDEVFIHIILPQELKGKY